ncbi:hydrogen gas-evolving membrane-bound hydrogenase subunit E [Halonatronum saccharophilum]|uniref:hydrogen gas-evolving membrane-bound hydrogenase subunit E n=1 Tax=Halonatronum saccharophilum TaxID=150060 RepID=UPI000487C709|nr:hydrogen gas-evolving membrane-bound hydrogenase subunit E [Halonatronum saccharophilum]
MKKIFPLILILIFASLLSVLLLNHQVIDRSLSDHYLQSGVEETGAINLVTAILFDYRGFDTLGEATVIFGVASAIAFLVPKKRATMLAATFSVAVYQTISFILPFLGVLGLYLILYGHLSPGGGFTGGVVIATISILLTITFGPDYSEKRWRYKTKTLMESFGGMTFIFIGLIGILAGSNFLANGQALFSLGKPGDLFSGGTISLLNLATGIKVGAGLAIIFNCMIKEE